MEKQKILTLNKIAKVGLDRFGDNYTVGDFVENPDGIMVRSALTNYTVPEED